jgi:WD40 repeat protein
VHREKISSVKYAGAVEGSSEIQALVMSASEDGSVKLWDRRTYGSVGKLEYQKKPFFSLDTNKNLIAAG